MTGRLPKRGMAIVLLWAFTWDINIDMLGACLSGNTFRNTNAMASASEMISEKYQELNVSSMLSLVDLIFLASVILKPVTSLYQEYFSLY